MDRGDIEDAVREELAKRHGLTDPDGELNSARVLNKLKDGGYWNVRTIATADGLYVLDDVHIRWTGRRRTIDEVSSFLRGMGLSVQRQGNARPTLFVSL